MSKNILCLTSDLGVFNVGETFKKKMSYVCLWYMSRIEIMKVRKTRHARICQRLENSVPLIFTY